MQLKHALALGVGGGAIAGWIAAAATSGGHRAAVADVPRSQPIDQSGQELAVEIKRLHDRLKPTAVPVQSRDLFRYLSRASSRRPGANMEPTAEPAAVVAPT